MSYTEKFYIGGTEYTSAVKKARLNINRNAGVDYGMLTLGKSGADAIASFDCGDSFEFRRNAGTNDTVLFRGEVDQKKVKNRDYEIRVIAKIKTYKELEIDDTWSDKTIEQIFHDVDDDTGVTIDALDAISDTSFSYYESKNRTKWDVVTSLAKYTGQQYWYDHKADKLIVYDGLITEYETYFGTFTTGTEILSIPTYEKTTDSILNKVTVLYSGGSVTEDNSTSIGVFGERKATFERPEITNSTDASVMAYGLLISGPHYTWTMKIKKAAWGEDGSGYEYFPLSGLITKIDDNINSQDSSTVRIDKWVINYPEAYDTITACKSFGSGETPAAIADQNSRLITVERNIDQEVKQTSGPTFASITTTAGINVGTVLNVADATGTAYPLYVNDSKAEAIAVLRNTHASAGRGVYVRVDNPDAAQYILDIIHGSTHLFKVHGDGKLRIGADDTNLYRGAANQLKTDDAFYAVGNITTDGTVDGVDIAAHAVDVDAHHKLPSPYEDTSCNVTQTGEGTDNTEMNALSSGYVSILPEKLVYNITVSDSGAGYVEAQLDDDSWVTLWSSGSTTSGTKYSYDIIDVLGQRGNYIKNLRAKAISVSGDVTVNLDIYGWQM